MGVTKTDFMRGMQCQRMLWLDKHHPELKVIPPEVQARLDAGNEFGDKAMGMFGPFVETTTYKADGKLDYNAMLQKTKEFMDNYDQLNEILVYLFDHALDIERNFLIRDTFKDISVNDMHVINAIGLHNEVNMSSLAKKVGVTVGTLTIAINGLVRKEYVLRTRSETDRRVVLVSLTEKGESAFRHHEDFHTRIVDAIHASLTEEECRILIKGLSSFEKNLKDI